MLFDTYDFEFLRLCGICRYLPTGLKRKYDAPYFSVNVIASLKRSGLIKIQSDKQSYKLTFEGYEILAEMGYSFPKDARMDLKRQSYKRKLKNALWNTTMHLAGINIFAETPEVLAGTDIGYVSSLVMRADTNIRVLAGTRFLGVLKIGEKVYIPYFLESPDDWVIPKHESEIYRGQVSVIRSAKSLSLMLTADTLEELWTSLHPETESEVLPRGMRRFAEALEEWGNDYLLVPSSREGVLQLRILQICRYRERLMQAIGCTPHKIEAFSECDGFKDNQPYIVAIDFNVQRILRALRQIERYDNRLTPGICCLSFQKKTLLRLLREHKAQKTMILSLDKSCISDVFPELLSEKQTQTPYMTREGRYVDANQRKVTKSAFKEC